VNRWGKFKKLSSQERRWLWQAWLLLPIVKLSLRLIGYRRTLWLLQALCVRKILFALAETDVAALGLLVNIAARYSVLPINCLPRALVLWWLLQRAGVVADLRIGVQKKGGALAAHAWVERAGEPLNERTNVLMRYVPFAISVKAVRLEEELL